MCPVVGAREKGGRGQDKGEGEGKGRVGRCNTMPSSMKKVKRDSEKAASVH